MKADLTRTTFTATKAFSGVLLQQGRVQIDADWNEQIDIQQHIDRTARIDEVGPCGAPVDDAGFAVAVSGSSMTIGAGRYYVDGILCENPDAVAIGAQPFWPEPDLPSGDGLYAVILDVHERLVTALQDEEIREVALGGPDHGARKQVAWQVRLVRLKQRDKAKVDCVTVHDDADVVAFTAASTGWMRAKTVEDATDVDPCTIPAAGGYRGLENQLYRVEVHQGTHALVNGVYHKVSNQPTFKWSRENGSVVVGWTGQPKTHTLQVTSLGRDRKLGFETGDLIELMADDRELGGHPGPLYRIAATEQDAIDLDPADTAPVFADFHGTPRVRRWEGTDDIKAAWISLENGVQVRFDKSFVYRTGDYWLIPARSITGEIEWDPDKQTPHGPAHHYCVLAIAEHTGGAWQVLHDCRPQFPAATELTRLSYLGGDGQEGMPGKWLAYPLRAGVSRGRYPVQGATVRFTLTGGGTLRDPDTGTTGTVLDVTTTADGVADVRWQLPPAPKGDLVVIAALLDAHGQPLHQAIHYNAAVGCCRPVLTYVSGDGQEGRPGQVLAESLRVRVGGGRGSTKGALVRFEVLGQRAWGQRLSLEAAGAVKGMHPVPWGRGREHGPWSDKYVVETDVHGLAQAQWMLGTESRLRAQRVRATLLDAARQETDQSITFSAGIESSDPKVRVVLSNGAEVDAPPGSVLPMLGFAGLRFLDLLVKQPPATTNAMAWWPGVKVTVQTTSLENDTEVGFEMVFPGESTPETDRSLLWRYRGEKTVIGVIPHFEVAASVGGASVSLSGPIDPASFTRSLDKTLTATGRPQLLLGSGKVLKRTAAKIDAIAKLPAGKLAISDALQLSAGTSPGTRTVLLMRVHLHPWMLPAGVAGDAADFDTWYWLDPESRYVRAT